MFNEEKQVFCMKKKGIIVLAIPLFLSALFIPKTIYADRPLYTIQCEGGGTMQTLDPPGPYNKCYKLDCGCGGFTLSSIPPPTASCNNCPSSQPTSVPYNPAEKPSCPNPGTGGIRADQIECAFQWADYYRNQQKKPTPTATPSATLTPTTYIPLPTFTPTPTPTTIPSPTIKQMPIQIQKQINLNNNFTNNLLQNIGKFFETITEFLKNFAGKK